MFALIALRNSCDPGCTLAVISNTWLIQFKETTEAACSFLFLLGLTSTGLRVIAKRSVCCLNRPGQSQLHQAFLAKSSASKSKPWLVSLPLDSRKWSPEKETRGKSFNHLSQSGGHDYSWTWPLLTSNSFLEVNPGRNGQREKSFEHSLGTKNLMWSSWTREVSSRKKDQTASGKILLIFFYLEPCYQSL